MPSTTHLVLIPSYNTGSKVLETVKAALAQWPVVWVVLDGSTDETPQQLQEIALHETGLTIWQLPANAGKGSAVLFGLTKALEQGYTHILTMDADGQHPAGLIPEFIRASQKCPQAVVLGKPVFDASVPKERLHGRKISNFFAKLITLSTAIGDSLYGFRVYPAASLKSIMESTRWMRRFDFDPEAAVRLRWKGHPIINLDAPVRYFTKAEGGVTHFRYGRDNVLLTWMYFRLILGLVCRLPWLVWQRLESSAQPRKTTTASGA